VPEQLRRLAQANDYDGLLEQVYALELLPRGVDRDMVVRFLAVVRAIGRATVAYRPPQMAKTVTLFAASDDTALDITRGWNRVAGADLDVVRLPGTHHTIAGEPNVEGLCHAINRAILVASSREESTFER
jgi:thioesterase domain-containing protein